MKAVTIFLLVLCCLAANVVAWRCRAGPQLRNVVQIDAGQGQVVARNTFSSYFLNGRGWYRLNMPRCKHVSVGTAGLWATDRWNRVYKFVGGNFLLSRGQRMMQVDAGGDEEVVGTSNTFTASCLNRNTAVSYRGGRRNLRWKPLAGYMKYISCSPRRGCWAINRRDQIFHTRGINPVTCGHFGWRRVPGGLKMIEVSTNGLVFGVNRSGMLFQRLGISGRYPYGRGWRRIPMCTTVRHVTYDLGRLWVVTTSGIIQLCTH